MAPSRTRTGRLTPPPEEATPACTLPCDLVLEIVARSDIVTVVRSAATCKPLRRDILSPAFVRRVCQRGPNGGVVPPFLVGYLRVENKVGWERVFFSLVHPVTPSTTSLSQDHLAPFLSRRSPGANGLGKRFRPLTSRNGLVVLRRWPSGICVYDPMTGNQAYLPHPPNIDRKVVGYWGYGVHYMYVLLTAADGIGCSFLLLATDSSVSRIQTAWSDSDAADGTRGWGPVISVAEPDRHRRGVYCGHSCAVVLDGSIHWLMCIGYASPPNIYILTYDVPRHGTRAATTTGSIEVPKACLPDRCKTSDLHLTTSPDKRLSLLVANRFTISVWLLSGSGSTGHWARQYVIDTEPIGSAPLSKWPSTVDFVSSLAGVRSGAVLLRPFMSWDFPNDKGKKGRLLVDIGTEEMHRVQKQKGFPYEVDMEARLSAMKIFD